ncbi:MAG: HAD family hydrolase [Candidatus Gracilibacteria bacterium]|nr:HAD family hydrolase [bacterium]MDZ4216862.1 HAD family hydrolase [Candidatus Gracilibacteria bacterium]
MNVPFSGFTTWLFDLDGTLIDSEPGVVACMKQTALDMGGKVTDEIELKASFGRGLINTLRPWIPESVSIDDAIAQYQKNFPRLVQQHLRLIDGVAELLELLSIRNIPMGVVTGNKHFEADGIFEQLGIGHYFDAVICADSIPFQKPSPEPVLEALKRLERSLEGSVFIGDSEHDIRAGRLAGVKTIAIRGGSSPEDRLLAAEPDFVVESIRDVLNKLGAMK